MSAGYLCTIHNISWIHQYMATIRKAIETSDQALLDLREKIIKLYA